MGVNYGKLNLEQALNKYIKSVENLNSAEQKANILASYGVGPKESCKIALVGEAPGAEEEKQGIPFVGSSGKLLDDMLTSAGISRDQCFITNVFKVRPPQNKVEHFFSVKKAAKDCGYQIMEGMEPIKSGSSKKFLKAHYYDHIAALREELTKCSANVIIPLGGIATWALTGINTISKMRGYVESWVDLEGRTRKILPSIHPAAVLRMWSFRPLCVMDLMKARRESEFPEINYINRTVYIPETVEEFEELESRFFQGHAITSLDIETARGQITRISLSRDPSWAVCIPFWDRTKPGLSYWSSLEKEFAVRKILSRILANSDNKLGQNGLYDLQYLLAESIPIFNYAEDTMLLHHALFPEMPKDLGTLGSLYTNEARWKDLRLKNYATIKRDE